MTTNTPKLKPCPFCGCQPELLSPRKDDPWWYVYCFCIGKTFLSSDDWKAISRWNARTGETTWQPIETAPRDGTEILVMCTMKRIGQPIKINCVANAIWIELDDGTEFWHDLEGIMSSDDVEYWMPLPLPPTGENK